MTQKLDLYFSPLACSMATRIALYEAGAEANFLEVDPKTKTIRQDNSSYLTVNPLGLVPSVRTNDGDILTENAAILQYVAETFPDAKIGAASAQERAKLQQWLCFIGTELHKGVFALLLSSKAPAEAKAYAVEVAKPRLDLLDKYLTSREFLLDRFTVADAYLVTVLNWSQATPMLDFSKWPNVQAYLAKHRNRPSVAKAMGEEFKLYQAELARHKAA